MKLLIKALVLFASVVLLSCADDGNPVGSPSIVQDDSYDGFVKVIHSKGPVVLGTNASGVRPSETPEMKVVLNYDFYMARHEVTVDEFKSLMDVETEAEDGDLPMVNVTYWDAVLYANAKSKSEKLDTVYTYTAGTFDKRGNCTLLEGFQFHPDVEGYRLPTEAEWMMVASQKWNTSRGWTAGNSDYAIHPVCSFEGSSDDLLCDMVGNAVEWVNDWMESFADTTITNYIGAQDGGHIGERVVKGGSFRNDAENIELYNRGDVYTVTSASKASYVGFRLALGVIPEPRSLGSGGLKESEVKVLASPTAVKNMAKTYRSKLVFRNDVTGNLVYIDFFDGTPFAQEIVDTIDSYHPEISPNGKWVAFSSGFEGFPGKSAVYVRRLNSVGTNMVRLEDSKGNPISAAIPRWHVSGSDTSLIYVSSAKDNEETTAFKSESTWEVPFIKGEFGTPTKLFDGAYHGGISSDNRFAVTGSSRLRARIADEDSDLQGAAADTVWYNSEQACNASLNPDGSKRTLFLDFGGTPGRKFAGEEYKTHQRILVADSTGKLIQAVPSPSGYSFDHTEWAHRTKTSKENLVVTSLTNSSKANPKIALVNMKDSSVLELAEAEELWHPSFWMEESFENYTDDGLSEDSAGVYLVPYHEAEQAKYRIKMELYWKHIQSTKILMVGSSRMEMGMNPDLVDEAEMLNVGVMGIDPRRDFYFVENYALNHCDSLTALVISVDLDGWHGNENHFALVYETVPGYKYDALHDFWKDSIPANFVKKVQSEYPAASSWMRTYTNKGAQNLYSRSWDSETIEILHDSVFTDDEMKFLDNHLNELESIAKAFAKKNVYVIGVIFPVAPQYKKTGAFGTYGLQRSVAEEKIKWLREMEKRNPNFILMDENKMGDHDYTDDMAYNRDHLSTAGANQLTERLYYLIEDLEPLK